MLSETNARGSVGERLTWLKLMESQCEELVAEGHDFRGFCWYPSIDTTDWWNCCTRATGITDPQGIWSLDPVLLTRIETALSMTYGSLARGEISSMHIPVHVLGNKSEEQSSASDALTRCVVVVQAGVTQ